MKICSLLILSGLFFFIPPTKAQVSDDDEAMAYRLKRKYPDERFAVVSDVEEYDLEAGKGDGNGPVVMATQTQRIQFISLREATALQYGEYYDKFSSISKMKLSYKSGNNFYAYKYNKVIDKSATSSDIFYDDSRV